MWVPHPFLFLERVGIPKYRLRGLQHGFLDLLGQANAHEALGGIEVVFAGLINDANLLVRRCRLVWYDAINLPQFERGRIIAVLDADREMHLGLAPWAERFHLTGCEVLGAGAPRSKPSVLRSSSRSGQWMP